MIEQRNAYHGFPERPVVRIGLMAVDGGRVEATLLADTGNPFAIIVGDDLMGRLARRAVPSANSNFGLLKGRWLRLFMPEFNLDREVVGYASNTVANAAKRSSIDFEGLAGLPLLRLFEFGGDPHSFWLHPAAC